MDFLQIYVATGLVKNIIAILVVDTILIILDCLLDARKTFDRVDYVLTPLAAIPYYTGSYFEWFSLTNLLLLALSAS